MTREEFESLKPGDKIYQARATSDRAGLIIAKVIEKDLDAELFNLHITFPRRQDTKWCDYYYWEIDKIKAIKNELDLVNERLNCYKLKAENLTRFLETLSICSPILEDDKEEEEKHENT